MFFIIFYYCSSGVEKANIAISNKVPITNADVSRVIPTRILRANDAQKLSYTEYNGAMKLLKSGKKEESLIADVYFLFLL